MQEAVQKKPDWLRSNLTEAENTRVFGSSTLQRIYLSKENITKLETRRLNAY